VFHEDRAVQTRKTGTYPIFLESQFFSEFAVAVAQRGGKTVYYLARLWGTYNDCQACDLGRGMRAT
jgi:hypothetical protein